MKDIELHKYIKLVSKVDTKGAMSQDDFFLVSESRDYFSFGQGILLNTFQNNPMMILKIFIDSLKGKEWTRLNKKSL